MAQTAQEYEKNFLDNIVTLTGETLKHWLALAQSSGLSKAMELTNYFKHTHKLNHAHSSILAGIYLNGGKAAFANTDDLLNKQLSGKEHLKPLYEKLIQFVQSALKETQVIPKVTYISLTGKKEFAAINFKKDEIRLGMALKNEPFTDELTKAKISGPMAHISHMLIITETKQLNNELSKHLKQSFINRNN
jgi:dsRNA-specific ribonuclease